MSIFKSTFKPYVIRQINTRQNLLSEVDRPVDFAHYVSSKSPWIRMTSLVDYEGKPDLAKKYVLMGGTLYNKPGTDKKTPTDRYLSRSGLGGAGASYGGLGTTQYGIRPMPGILSMKTRSLGAYGSLSEATIKFQAWDVKQLEDLSILFLRPGYKVVVEWGWSMYLDTFVSGESYREKATTNALKYAADNYKITNAAFNTIDCFSPNITQTGIYEQLDKLKHKYSGNYDGVLGSIKQFDYTLMPNGSYECTTVLISIGDTIETIRMNDTLGISVNEFGKPKEDPINANPNSITDTQQTEEFKSQFELLMDSYCKLNDENPRSKSDIIVAIDKLIGENLNYIDPFIYKYKDTYVENVKSIIGKDKYTIPIIDFITPKPVNSETLVDKRSYYYIQFGYLLHILNVFKNIFAERDQKLVDIEIPSDPKNTKSISNGLCQASFNSISIDPNSAIIRNSKATLFTDAIGNRGFRPEVFKTESKYYNGFKATDINLNEFLYDDTNFGTIGNVYINIKEAISLYKQQINSNKGYVYVGKYISDILDKAAFSLGSINDFDKFIKDDKVVIIDKHYTELSADSKYTNKFKINVSGNNSIVRNHKIQSKIFPSQATMIAIAAQDRENISAIQTSTYNYLNKGLKDRLFGNKVNRKEDIDINTGLSELANKRKKLSAILALIQFVNNYVMVNNSMGSYYNTNVGTMNGYLNTLLVEMEGGTDYKAIVPISVDLTTDGLSGLTIGEIFTVDKKVLPRDYENKAVGFIITGISNEIVTNGWTTSISSQMCLLDQDKRQLITRQKAEELLKELQGESENKKVENQTSAIYFNILAALAMDAFIGKYFIRSIEGKIEYSDPLYTKIAVSEYANGLVDIQQVFDDFQRAYNATYPKEKSNEYQNFIENKISDNMRLKKINYIEKDTGDPGDKKYVSNGYSLVVGAKYTVFDIDATSIDRDYARTGASVSGDLGILRSDAFYTNEFRFINLKNPNALLPVIKEMSFYKAMVKDIQNSFESEYNRVKSDIVTKNPLNANSYIGSADVTEATALFNQPDVNPTQQVYINILDVKKVVDETGLLVRPLPFIVGYKYKYFK